jgi:hypothetical protein
MRVFFTDNNVKTLKDTNKWLLQSAQVGKQEQLRGRSAHQAKCAQKMLAILTSSWQYNDDMSNTAEMVARKLVTIYRAHSIDDETGAETPLYDANIFFQWMMFLLCSFTDPTEGQLLDCNNKITGRGSTEENAPTHKLESDDSDHMAIGEIPFPRQLTNKAFLLQFIRLLLGGVYENIIKPSIVLSKSSDELGMSPSILFDAVLAYAQDEGDVLKALVDQRGVLDNAAYTEVCDAHLCRQRNYWRGNQSNIKKTEKKVVVAGWIEMREYLNAFQMDEEIQQLPQTRAFIGAFFPVQF